MRFESFCALLNYWAEKRADSPALRWYDKTLDFASLRDAVTERARELKDSKKTCLGLLSDGSMDCVITLLAANMAGMQLVMLDQNAPEELLKALIAYTDVDMLWGDEELCGELSCALTGGVKDGGDKILFFTSGTTSRSKAVVLTGHSLCQSAYNGSAKLPLTGDDTLLCMLPLGHVFGFVCGLLWGLSCGACVALGRGARYYGADLDYYKPTAVSLVPLLLGFLIKQNALNAELKNVLVGAGDCPAPLLSAVSARGIRLSFGYGLTETSSGVAISTGGDPYAMEICPDDTISIAPDGEVLIHAPTCVMQGYYKNPDATAAVLIDGVLHSGDLGFIDGEGRLHITGRKKDILVLPDGTKLYLPEYEGDIVKTLGESELAVVLKNSRPVLYYKGERSREELSALLKPLMATLPRGQQLADIIITEQELPRTATGKIKRWEIQQKVSST